MSHFRPVVFDLDGTLVHSAPDLHAAANRMLAGLGRRQLSLAEVTGFVGNGVPKLVERCLAATGGVNDLQPGALSAFRLHYDAAPAERTRPYAGAMEALHALRRAGCRLGICTNKPEAPARRLLALLGMDTLFEQVIGGDTLPVQKPDPAPLLQAIEAVGGERDSAIYVGDSEVDAATAANAGVAFCLFTRGYRRTPADRIRAALAFDEFTELSKFVLT